MPKFPCKTCAGSLQNPQSCVAVIIWSSSNSCNSNGCGFGGPAIVRCNGDQSHPVVAWVGNFETASAESLIALYNGVMFAEQIRESARYNSRTGEAKTTELKLNWNVKLKYSKTVTIPCLCPENSPIHCRLLIAFATKYVPQTFLPKWELQPGPTCNTRPADTCYRPGPLWIDPLRVERPANAACCCRQVFDPKSIWRPGRTECG